MNYSVLSTEVTTDPLSRGYSGMTDQAVADSLNEAADRPDRNSLGAMLSYLLTIKHRTNSGTDIVFTPVIGRLSHAAESAVGSDPFGSGNSLSLEQKHACAAVMMLFTSPHLSAIDFSDTSLPFGYVNAAGVWNAAHRDALTALSQNQQTRARELGLGQVTAGDVNYVRAA